jgi:hypothetical protein
VFPPEASTAQKQNDGLLIDRITSKEKIAQSCNWCCDFLSALVNRASGRYPLALSTSVFQKSDGSLFQRPLISEIESYVDNHVFLTSDHASAAQLDQNLTRVDAVTLRGALGMA